MPSERIYPIGNDPELVPDCQPMHVHIQWGRDTDDINIGTVWDDPDKDQAFYVTIRNRRQVNRLIRTLQRARDHAFGEDA